MSEPKTQPEENAGFLGRWSRRKVLARQGALLQEPIAPLGAAPVAPLQESTAPLEAAPVAPVPAQAPEGAPKLPSLADVKALTAESDFVPFMARGVAPGVRNAAMKKLFFADPHFNVMDGLDIYIDDYSKPSPLSAAMLKNLASARFLGLIDDEPAKNEEEPAEGGAGASSAGLEPAGSLATEGDGLTAVAPVPAPEPDKS